MGTAGANSILSQSQISTVYDKTASRRYRPFQVPEKFTRCAKDQVNYPLNIEAYLATVANIPATMPSMTGKCTL